MTARKTIGPIARAFQQRSEALGYKGKKRDDAALDFFLGAAVSARLLGHEDFARYVETNAGLVLATRGYGEVARLATLPDEIDD